MSYKTPRLRSSIIYYADSKNKLSLNLDLWLRKFLIDLNVITNAAPCCTEKNLFIKKGFYMLKSKQGVSLNHIIRKLLNRYGVAINTYCCFEKDVKVHNSSVIYTSEKVQFDLALWLKQSLAYYSIPYTDPCCI